MKQEKSRRIESRWIRYTHFTSRNLYIIDVIKTQINTVKLISSHFLCIMPTASPEMERKAL